MSARVTGVREVKAGVQATVSIGTGAAYVQIVGTTPLVRQKVEELKNALREQAFAELGEAYEWHLRHVKEKKS